MLAEDPLSTAADRLGLVLHLDVKRDGKNGDASTYFASTHSDLPRTPKVTTACRSGDAELQNWIVATSVLDITVENGITGFRESKVSTVSGSSLTVRVPPNRRRRIQLASAQVLSTVVFFQTF